MVESEGGMQIYLCMHAVTVLCILDQHALNYSSGSTAIILFTIVHSIISEGKLGLCGWFCGVVVCIAGL